MELGVLSHLLGGSNSFTLVKSCQGSAVSSPVPTAHLNLSFSPGRGLGAACGCPMEGGLAHNFDICRTALHSERLSC